MKWTYNLFLITILVFTQTQAQVTVKVLLDQASYDKRTTWKFESNGKFSISIPGSKQKKLLSHLKITTLNNKIYLDGKRYRHKAIQINPEGTPVAVDNNPYNGSFTISRLGNNTTLVNSVELEKYICSVLNTESWPGWPKEVNKVFAIASRSYVLAQVLRARKSKLPYHIKNTNHHQTYSGMHNKIKIKDAVLETKNIILGYNDEPILAMFDSCCGGIIPAHIDGFDFYNHPYLARTQQCLHCKPFKVYSWQATYSNQDFKKTIKQALPHLRKIKKISTKTDKAGTVKAWLVHGTRDVHSIDARTMYSLFKEIKSFSFSIDHNINSVQLDGTGYGHHLGLCQWGAREMINKGYRYRDVLKFYYPGAKFMKIKS